MHLHSPTLLPHKFMPNILLGCLKDIIMCALFKLPFVQPTLVAPRALLTAWEIRPKTPLVSTNLSCLAD